MSEQELVQFLSNLDSSTLAQLLVNYKKVADGGTTLASTLTSNETSKKLIELQTGANLVCNGAKTLNEGINGNNTIENPGLKGYISQLTTGAESLDEGMIEYTDGVNSLVTGTKQLVDKNDELIEGVSELKAGTQKITDGTQKLLSGSVTLGNGLNTVSNGILQLNTSLKEGVKKAQIDTNDETFDMIASPVETQHKEISIVENNGHAMAPYMMSVALYVAALAFTLMYPIRHGIKETKNAIKYWTSKATVMYTTSTLAAILLITALRIFNGFEPQQLIMTYIFAIITSVAFMSLIILISLTTGYIGEFLLLVFMIINLGGSAGTYPLETSTALYKAIHRFVPYTYTVDGFRKLISMPNATVRTEILILLGIFIVCTLLTILYFHFKNKEDKHLIPEAFESVNEVEN